MAVNVYNLAPGKGVIIGDSVAIVEPKFSKIQVKHKEQVFFFSKVCQRREVQGKFTRCDCSMAQRSVLNPEFLAVLVLREPPRTVSELIKHM